jgi:hypothetical protein
MGKSIEDCLQCHRVCLRNFSHLLTLEPDAERANPEQLSLLLDCAAAIPADLRTARGHRPCRTRVRPNLRAVPQFLQKSPRHLRRTLMPICRDAARSAVADGRPQARQHGSDIPSNACDSAQFWRADNSVDSPGTLRPSRANYLMKRLRR